MSNSSPFTDRETYFHKLQKDITEYVGSSVQVRVQKGWPHSHFVSGFQGPLHPQAPSLLIRLTPASLQALLLVLQMHLEILICPLKYWANTYVHHPCSRPPSVGDPTEDYFSLLNNFSRVVDVFAEGGSDRHWFWARFLGGCCGNVRFLEMVS